MIDPAAHRVSEAIQRTNAATNSYTEVLNTYSSIILQPGEPATMRAAVADEKVFKGYYDLFWPTADVNLLSNSVSLFADEYQNLVQQPGYSDWAKDEANKQLFTYYQSQIAALAQHLVTLGPNSDAATKLSAAQQTVDGWREQFYKVAHFADADFAPAYNSHCNTWFGKSKTDVVKLITKDRLSSTSTEQSSDLVTVVCNSSLTVTTGIGFTTLGKQTAAFVAGKDAKGNLQQQIGFSSNSNVSPIYALQISNSIREFDSAGGIGIHASLGAAIGTTSGNGASLDFLFGPSLSFRRRTLFVTPAFLLGQRTELLPGFKAGDPQGSLTSPPTTLTWRPGFALTLTFPISQ